MDTKSRQQELIDTVSAEDKEILDVIKEFSNELDSDIDSDEEREADNSAIWYYNLETKEDCNTPSILGWEDHYDSDSWSDYESFNRQVQLERMWDNMEREEESNFNTETSTDNFNIVGNSSLEDEEYDWEKTLGSGYWDSNGGSPQWVPVKFNETESIHDLSI